MKVRLCDSCGYRRAVVLQRHTGRALCLECFRDSIVDRVKVEVSRWRLIEPSDTVMMALSGGKDSYVLLDVLPEVVRPSRLFGLSIIEGIPGYNREEDVRALREAARERGVDVIVTSIREYVGLSLSEIYSRARMRGSKHVACTFCGIARRRIMNFYARIHGASKVATAHNLDDEAQTAVINFLRGDVAGLVKMHPLSRPKGPGVIARVKPLRKIYEWETASLALLMGFRFQETECPFISMQPTLRARVREALYRAEVESPGTLLKMMDALDSALAHVASRSSAVMRACRLCGEATTGRRDICKFCELMGEAGVAKPIYRLRVGGLASVNQMYRLE